MFFGYGWPRIFSTGSAKDEEWFYLHNESQYLIAASPSSVQVWSTGLHRVKLSQVTRTQEDVSSEGTNLCAFWSAAKATLAVVTSNDYLHLYSIHVWKDSLLPNSSTAAKDLSKADIYLRSSSRLERSGATCITGDSRLLLIGQKDGSLTTYSWLGKLREIAEPMAELYMDDPTPAISSMHYCEKSKAMVLVLADGSCALCEVSAGGLSPLHELVFSHWVCSSMRQATCARIGASAQLVAVGCSNGELALYRMHGQDIPSSPHRLQDSPVRILSLESWGHKSHHTGEVAKVTAGQQQYDDLWHAVNQVEWAPDCRAIAVGFRNHGLVVWSPSGCRLLCSLRHTAGLSSRLSGCYDEKTAASGQLQTAAGSGEEAGWKALESGVVALGWGAMGYQLVVSEAGAGHQLVEMQFARSLSHHRVAHANLAQGQQSGEELYVLQAHDRLLIIAEAMTAQSLPAMHATAPEGHDEGPSSNDLLITHVAVPYQYISANWPIMHAAVSSNGIDMAVAGRKGLAVYSRASDKWRLFGDISQERKISCKALSWLDNIIVVCSGPADSDSKGSGGSSGHELLLLPRYHLDFASLLCRYVLPQPPLAMDCVGSHILIASEPLEIALLEVVITGALTPMGKPKAQLQLVREISMLDVGRPLLDMALVPAQMLAAALSAQQQQQQQQQGAVPRQCVLLRWGGLMSVLDLEKGSEIALSTEVECFWLADSLTCQAPTGSPQSSSYPSRGGSAAVLDTSLTATSSGQQIASAPNLLAGAREGVTDMSSEASTTGLQLDVEMPWWAYGPQGMQLVFPSSLAHPLSPKHEGAQHTDIELEFDQEVYPVGISLADASIIGITQRITRGVTIGPAAGPAVLTPGDSSVPCFHPTPESQPVLPCLLRRLLQRGAFQDALSLARRHARGPHFTRSLEWLLFTTLEMEASKPLSKRANPAPHKSLNEGYHLGRTPAGESFLRANHGPGTSNMTTIPVSPLLSLAAELVRQFAQFAEVVVSVARKTDAQLWPALFSAVGPPNTLLEGMLEAGALGSAACFLLVIDRLEGAGMAHIQALRLLRSALKRSQYHLVGELLRFIIPPGEVDATFSEPTSPTTTLAAQAAHLGLGGAEPAKAAAQPTKAQSSSWLSWLFGGTASEESEASGMRKTGSASSVGSNPAAATLAVLDLQRGRMPSSNSLKSSSPSKKRPTGDSLSDSLAPAAHARQLVAEHAWHLLEAGRLRALCQLSSAVNFLTGGLVQLMKTHQVGQYANEGLTNVSAVELLSAVAIAAQEFPVWNGADVERTAKAALELVKALGGTAWTVALSIVVVNVEDVRLFMAEHQEVWNNFVDVLKSDKSFYYLNEIVDHLSGISNTQQEGLSQRANNRHKLLQDGEQDVHVQLTPMPAGSASPRASPAPSSHPSPSPIRPMPMPQSEITVASPRS